jgi:hypothetical protein
MMLGVMAISLGSLDASAKRAAMFAAIAETLGMYGELHRPHEAIAPFLPVRMRTVTCHRIAALKHPCFVQVTPA